MYLWQENSSQVLLSSGQSKRYSKKAERETFPAAQIRGYFFFLPIVKFIMTVSEKFVILIVVADVLSEHAIRKTETGYVL